MFYIIIVNCFLLNMFLGKNVVSNEEAYITIMFIIILIIITVFISLRNTSNRSNDSN